MKRRIISTILVVVMLTLTLVGCGYSFANDDMSQYASFDKTAFDAALASLVIADGDFSADEQTRQQKVLDYIYELLLDEVDTKDTALRLTTGALSGNEILYYCYYATYVNSDNQTVIVYPSQMKYSAASSVSLGYNELDHVPQSLKETVLAIEGDIDGYIYSTVTSGTAASGKVAFVSYTFENGDEESDDYGEKTSYSYKMVTLGDESDPVAKNLAGATIGTAIDAFTDDAGNSYSGAKVEWVVDGDKSIDELKALELTFTHDMHSETSVADVEEGTSVTVPEGTILTYHVYPTYYYEVTEFSAEVVLKTLVESLTKDSLDCLADCEELISTFNEALTEHTEAETALEEAEGELEDAEDALETAKTNAETAAKESDGAEGLEGDALTEYVESYVNADATVAMAIITRDEAQTVLDDASLALDSAKVALDDALKAIFEKVGEDAEEGESALDAGKSKIEEEYKESVYDVLLEAYNEEIKNNLALALWELMTSSVTVSGTPKKGVNEIYDRMYESYEYTFYTGTDSTTSESNYNAYDGSFKEYLAKQMGAANFKAAKEALREEAEEYVTDIVIVYFVAEQYGLEYTKAEIKEYKKDESGDYEYYEYYQGETNALVAYQFDRIMNHFLESETDEDTGNVTYKNIGYTVEAEESED